MPVPQGNQHSSNVSQRYYYAYCLHARPGEPSIIFHGGNLLQEYVVDAWASCEQSALNWARYHQKELCADLYQNLQDATSNLDGVDANIGE